MNADFQKIARRDKKAFLSDQCKEAEENNKMGKTRDLFRKTRDTNGEGNGTPLQYSCLESHGQRNLVGFSPWGREESDMTE